MKNWNMTRRDLVRGVLLGGISSFAVSPRCVRADTVHGKSLSSSDRRVTLLPAADPLFSTTVEKVFRGLTSRSHFDDVRPLAALITNNSELPVRGYCIRWLLTNPDATIFDIPIFFYSNARGRQLISGRHDIIKHGETRLVTPLFTINDSKLQQKSNSDFSTVFTSSKFGRFLADKLSSTTGIDVQLDAVAFSDGVVIGRDDADFANRFRIILNAEHDEAVSLGRLIRNKAPAQIIEAKIHGHIRADAARRTSGYEQFYFRARSRHAKLLASALQRGQRRAVGRALWALHKTPRLILEHVPTVIT